MPNKTTQSESFLTWLKDKKGIVSTEIIESLDVYYEEYEQYCKTLN